MDLEELKKKFRPIKEDFDDVYRVISSIEDPELKFKELDKFEDEEKICMIAKTIDDVSLKLKVAERLKNSQYKKELVISIEDENARLEAAKLFTSISGFEKDIKKTIKNPDIRQRILQTEKQRGDALDLARSWELEDIAKEIRELGKKIIYEDNPDSLVEIFKGTNYKWVKYEIANTFLLRGNTDYFEIILPEIMEIADPQTIISFLERVKIGNNNFIEELMKNDVYFQKILSAEIVKAAEILNIITNMSEDTKFKFLQAKIKKEGTDFFLRTYLDKISYENMIKELDKIMELFGVQANEIEEKKELLMKMCETNHDVIKTIDYKILDTKYVEKLGLDKINTISSHSEIQEKILGLTEKELDILMRCVEDYILDAETADWETITKAILDNLSKKTYDDLINDIDDLEKIDIDILRGILQSENVYNVKKVEDIKRFEEIKSQKTDELIKSAEINDKREAVLGKIYGVDIKYAREIVRDYGSDIESILESDVKDFIKSLQCILDCNSPEMLEQIYNECLETTFIDKIMIEKAIKTEYGKLYSKDLLKTEGLEQIGENMYSAGTDFRMIIHSVAACDNRDKYSKNYKDDWNRPITKSQYFSTSYIRNDMLGTAGRHELCYGFAEMLDDALMEAGPTDIASAPEGFTSGAAGKMFLSPDTMIDKSCPYNELSYRRTQNGKRLQPSYIVVFKYEGVIENLENAKQAQKDWGGLPIVVIDVEECLKSERAKVDVMIEEYEANPSVELAKKIRSKINNNRKFRIDAISCRYPFCEDIDVERFKIVEDGKSGKTEISEEDLEENYTQVTPTERKEQASKLKRIFECIREINGGGR